MNPKSTRWKALAPSQFPWEREALDWIRDQLPDQEPYRAWSLFEFLAEDGSINEVDLLLLTPRGFYLVEIKSRTGLLTGDAGTWTWRSEGRDRADDNPLILANRKAKRLKSLLERAASKQRIHLPFDHNPRAQRLDHLLRERGSKLSLDTRLHLVRRIAEALRYAHGKGLYHRALSPQSVLVADPTAAAPEVRLFNRQPAPARRVVPPPKPQRPVAPATSKSSGSRGACRRLWRCVPSSSASRTRRRWSRSAASGWTGLIPPALD